MADIREQDLALKTTIADTDWIRLVTPTGNHRMTVGQFKDLIGYTTLQSDVTSLKTGVTTTINTFSNGWEGSITLSRYGDLVSIQGNLTKTGTVTSGTILTTIPVDFRPSLTTPIVVAKSNIPPYTSSFLFWLLSSGVLEIRTSDTIPANQSNAQIRINQVYSV